MLTGDLRNKVDQVWNAFWSGGIANPIEVIEQITYLLFLRALDSDQTREDNKALRLKTQPVRLIPAGVDAQGRPHDNMRWAPLQEHGACRNVRRAQQPGLPLPAWPANLGRPGS